MWFSGTLPVKTFAHDNIYSHDYEYGAVQPLCKPSLEEIDSIRATKDAAGASEAFFAYPGVSYAGTVLGLDRTYKYYFACDVEDDTA